MTKLLSKHASDRIAVTAGEPAGIGPELCLALVDSPWSTKIVVIADLTMLADRAAAIGRKIKLSRYDPDIETAEGSLQVLDVPLAEPATPGNLNPANVNSLLDGLRRAVEGCQSGEFAALVTAPLQKSVINDAGVSFKGHTEFLAELTDTGSPVMLLIADELRVALATTHLPLKDVPAALSTDGIVRVIEVLHNDLVRKFRIERPDIAVCGLNPHAGECGHLGAEDRLIIQPAIDAATAQGIQVRGPLPADTAFTPASGKADAILAMYHDQGLPVIKYAGFGNSVNITLGLPIIRT
ncbi:MAG: 4-hydroxythreonine-4-phosphate dehydrogenase PdxA, partial [Woeseiaceae bacterium]|nr:4-hydroxythreonine-4-phosphate dehydrogenase PdxA [Woeseiaceae bacterium]